MKLGGTGLVLGNAQAVGGRKEQQDYLAILPVGEVNDAVQGVWLVVADGMGGHQGGASASVVAVDAFLKAVGRLTEVNEQVLRKGFEAANEAVVRWAGDSDAGTTMVALFLDTQGFQWGSVGDSRIFHIRNGLLERLNHDHNLGAQLDRLVAAGKMSPEDADARGPERRYLTSYLGKRDGLVIELSEMVEWRPGDTFVLASDGLSDALSLAEIVSVEQRGRDSDTLAEELVSAAIDKGRNGQDNVSVVSVHLDAAAGHARFKMNRTSAALFGCAVLAVAGVTYVALQGGSAGPEIVDRPDAGSDGQSAVVFDVIEVRDDNDVATDVASNTTDDGLPQKDVGVASEARQKTPPENAAPVKPVPKREKKKATPPSRPKRQQSGPQGGRSTTDTPPKAGPGAGAEPGLTPPANEAPAPGEGIVPPAQPPPPSGASAPPASSPSGASPSPTRAPSPSVDASGGAAGSTTPSAGSVAGPETTVTAKDGVQKPEPAPAQVPASSTPPATPAAETPSKDGGK